MRKDILTQKIKVYNAIADYLNRWGQKKIDEYLDGFYSKEDPMPIEEMQYTIEEILEDVEWHKERHAQFMIYGDLFEDVPEKKDYRDVLGEYYEGMAELWKINLADSVEWHDE